MLRFQSLERKIVTGKVLIVGWLGLLYPYLPDRSRLARAVISRGAARLGALFSYFYYMGGCQVLVGELWRTGPQKNGWSGAEIKEILRCPLSCVPLLENREKWATPRLF
jgi:hypothetical protein